MQALIIAITVQDLPSRLADYCAASAQSMKMCLHDTNPLAVGQDNRSADVTTQISYLASCVRSSIMSTSGESGTRVHVHKAYGRAVGVKGTSA
ncbi:MAG: hypothetical protein FRX49_07276 [Trebouxia sp. A1-2]|nr:MAG: hypothetical protein FRX49_07276 [Trebouxia sp. A1-2]